MKSLPVYGCMWVWLHVGTWQHAVSANSALRSLGQHLKRQLQPTEVVLPTTTRQRDCNVALRFSCVCNWNKKKKKKKKTVVGTGVIVYEAISDAPAFGFSKREQVNACARRERAYAWEPPFGDSLQAGNPGANRSAFERSRVRNIVLQCLARNASERPSALQLVAAIDRISNATRTAVAPGGSTSIGTGSLTDSPCAEGQMH